MVTERDKILRSIGNEMIGRINRRGRDVDVIGVPGLCRAILNCIGSIDYDFESIDIPFAFKISIVDYSSSESILTPSTLPEFIRKNCNASTNVIEIDYSGRFFKMNSEYFDSKIAAVEFSEKNNDFIFFIYGRQIEVIVNGIAVDHVANASSFRINHPLTGFELNIDEWEKILINYEQQLKSQKRFFYWATPKTEMKLLDSPEKHFRKDLAKFIEENTFGCFVDEEAYNDNGDNRVDIRTITALELKVYYFELKCLGQCISGTSYGNDHAHQGLVQTNTYVADDENSVLGVLVIFDGRRNKTVLTWPDKIKKILSSKVHFPPKEIKLETESASSNAKKIVKSIKP